MLIPEFAKVLQYRVAEIAMIVPIGEPACLGRDHVSWRSCYDDGVQIVAISWWWLSGRAVGRNRSEAHCAEWLNDHPVPFSAQVALPVVLRSRPTSYNYLFTMMPKKVESSCSVGLGDCFPVTRFRNERWYGGFVGHFAQWWRGWFVAAAWMFGRSSKRGAGN